MRTTIACLALFFIIGVASAQTANPNYDETLAKSLNADDYGMKSYILAILKTGENLTATKEESNTAFTGHMENMRKLVKEGKLIVAGPLGKNDKTYRGIFILDVPLLGLHFDDCNPFGIEFGFQNCILNHASFFKMKFKKTVFKDCQLIETDFSECDVTSSTFDNCDLSGATFDATNLEKADFRTSFNYIIDPEINKIKKAKFALPEVLGLLSKYDIVIEK